MMNMIRNLTCEEYLEENTKMSVKVSQSTLEELLEMVIILPNTPLKNSIFQIRSMLHDNHKEVYQKSLFNKHIKYKIDFDQLLLSLLYPTLLVEPEYWNKIDFSYNISCNIKYGEFPISSVEITNEYCDFNIIAPEFQEIKDRMLEIREKTRELENIIYRMQLEKDKDD